MNFLGFRLFEKKCNQCNSCVNNKSGVLSDVNLKEEVKNGNIKIGVSREYKEMLKREGFVGDISDVDIESQVGPCSIDLRLGYDIIEYEKIDGVILDTRDIKKNGINPNYYKKTIVQKDEGFVFYPDRFYLGTTIESVTIPAYLRALVEGKSTIGRLGVIPHAAAGYIDPGFGLNLVCSEFGNQITLEIKVLNSLPIRCYPGDFICQLEYSSLMTRAENSYDKRKSSAYQKQVGVVMPTAKNLSK